MKKAKPQKTLVWIGGSQDLNPVPPKYEAQVLTTK
jgi:hypothetical protein